MLNAFRHHRNSHVCRRAVSATGKMCSTPFGIIGILTTAAHATHHKQSCAQRLSASSEFSPGFAPRPSLKALVLNAFRHHRNSHLLDLQGSSGMGLVLNAFRHHRNSHLRETDALRFELRCSTPFGIIGILTRAEMSSRADSTCAQRLSASSEFSHRTQPPQPA